MQTVKVNIRPEDEQKCIQALDDSHIPYWLEQPQQVGDLQLTPFESDVLDKTFLRLAKKESTRHMHVAQQVGASDEEAAEKWLDGGICSIDAREAFLAACSHKAAQFQSIIQDSPDLTEYQKEKLLKAIL